jgi:hypothetical protein
VLRAIQLTKGAVSTSERVNELLKVGLEAERIRGLHSEAAAFFKSENDRKARKALQSASIKSVARD